MPSSSGGELDVAGSLVTRIILSVSLARKELELREVVAFTARRRSPARGPREDVVSLSPQRSPTAQALAASRTCTVEVRPAPCPRLCSVRTSSSPPSLAPLAAPRKDNGYGARASQGAQNSPRGYGGSPPTGPRHAGLGSAGVPSSLPGRPSNLPPTPTAAAAVAHGGSPPVDGGAAGALGMQAAAQGERFSLFVGTIVDGLENAWLERILGVRPLSSRCIRLPRSSRTDAPEPLLAGRRTRPVVPPPRAVHGFRRVRRRRVGPARARGRARRPDQDEGRRREGAARQGRREDEGTARRIREGARQGRGASRSLYLSLAVAQPAAADAETLRLQDTDDLTEQAKGDLSNILTRIANGDPVTSHDDPNADPADRKPRIPQHLKDLAPEDLPESHRDNTLSSIALFRQAAQKKAQAKHDLDRQIEERRQAAIVESVRLQHQQQHQPARQGPAGSPPLGASPSPAGAFAAAQDPQSFNRPMTFVVGASTGAAAPLKPLSELDDARRERDRAEREYRQAEGVFRNVRRLSPSLASSDIACARADDPSHPARSARGSSRRASAHG